MTKIKRARYEKVDGTQVEEVAGVSNQSLPGRIGTKFEDLAQALFPSDAPNKLEVDGQVVEEWRDKEPDRFKNIMNLLKGKN
jgi:hypothetical protein